MRIVHIACVAPPQTGGIGRVAYEEVLRQVQAGHEAVLLAPAHAGVEVLPYVIRISNALHVGNASVLDLGELLPHVENADIVHLHHPYYGTAERIANLKRRGKIKRLVITFHMDAQAQGWKGNVFELHRRFWQKHILLQADRILVSSWDYAKESSLAKLLSQLPVTELPFGVDTKRFQPGTSTRSQFGLPEDAPMIGFVGGMDTAHAFKGVDILLQAFARCAANTHLVLAGDGDLRSSYEAKAKEFGVDDRCHFLGRVSDEQLPAVYQAMDVFAFPSISQAEAFGLVALEAQACGIPVVASDLPGVRTVIQHRVTGFLSEPSHVEELAANLRLLLENPDMRKTFGAAAREYCVQHFSWEAHAEQLNKLYRELTDSAKS